MMDISQEDGEKDQEDRWWWGSCGISMYGKCEGRQSLIVGLIEEKEWANGVGEGIRWDFSAAS